MGRQWPSGTWRPGWNGKAGPVPVQASERDSTSGQAIQEMLQTPDDRTIASKLAIVTAHTRSSVDNACLNPKITKATLTARSADLACARFRWPVAFAGDQGGMCRRWIESPTRA